MERVAYCVLRERTIMTYKEWLETVPRELTEDPLWRMEVYRLSVFAADLAWPDATKLIQDKRTISLADQLYRAVGSVSGNIAEGYGRQSGKDQARYYEYALGVGARKPKLVLPISLCANGPRCPASHAALNPDYPPAAHHHPQRAWLQNARRASGVQSRI